jgi:hypothetical protein
MENAFANWIRGGIIVIQHIWTVPCRFAITDAATGRISIFEVIDELDMPAVPIPVPAAVPAENRVEAGDPAHANPLPASQIHVVTLWRREPVGGPDHAHMRFSVVGPDGVGLAGNEFEIDLRQQSRLYTIGRMPGFPIGGPGTYRLRFEQQSPADNSWQIIGDVPIDITIGGNRAVEAQANDMAHAARD